ncbi:ornithine cyclodeaminase [Pacificimonas flava]|uniref:Ornithine cyclodeaminase n=3 Tax=Pacificimonas TaxID=1960290 RepID=A0A219B3G6_9SPHN|nr:ornithine cyclodeaminase family protein [Pacificimonas aurantium]MBZ6377584.1 ornithine cyclodeaminase family protein [Pacificimonas aurantium]OWV32724.1 ornithine cyclodeaminase [Pacificimonas flava]
MAGEALRTFDGEAVRRHLDYPSCLKVVRDAMMALSAGRTRQLLRSMIQMGEGRTFAQMPGTLGDDDMFGAKLISVFADPDRPGTRRHRGLVVMFEPENGRPVCVADAEEITHIRTAAASAVATDALAKPDARTLLIAGTGGQARSHLHALPLVRTFDHVVIWGRDPAKAEALAQDAAEKLGLPATSCRELKAAAERADVICTLTTAREPFLFGDWIRPGTHINLVGSSAAGPVEVDTPLVARSRYFVDSRASALDAAAEFLVARDEGAVADSHILAEIGDVLLNRAPGRESPSDITVYKSLGHAVQDLAAAAHLYRS